MRKNYRINTKLPPLQPAQQAVREHVQRAIRLHSTVTNLARAAKTTGTTISTCVRNGHVSFELALRIEKATGGKVNRCHLCPEIFDVPGIPEPGFDVVMLTQTALHDLIHSVMHATLRVGNHGPDHPQNSE